MPAYAFRSMSNPRSLMMLMLLQIPLGVVVRELYKASIV